MPEDNSPLKPGRSRMPSEQKDKIRAEQLARRLYKFANAKGKSAAKHGMSQAQVTAAKVLIDKGKPSLQAVEQTNVEEPKSEAQILELIESQLHSLVANPGIRARLKALLDGSAPSLELVAPHQTAKSA